MDMEMDYDFEKKCVVDVDGFIEGGKQFDLEKDNFESITFGFTVKY